MYVGVLLSFPSLWGPFKGILGHMLIIIIIITLIITFIYTAQIQLYSFQMRLTIKDLKIYRLKKKITALNYNIISSVAFSVWPIHHHTRCSISSCTGRCPACLQSSLIRILLGHQTTRMLLRHLLIKTCNFCFSPLVNLHVSALCKSTAFLFHPSHTWVSPPTPLLLTTYNARRYLESSTFSVSSLTIITRLILLYEHNRI